MSTNLNQADRHSDTWEQISKHADNISKHTMALIQTIDPEVEQQVKIMTIMGKELLPRQEKFMTVMDEIQKLQKGGKLVTKQKLEEVRQASKLFVEALFNLRDKFEEDSVSATIIGHTMQLYNKTAELLNLILTFATENEAIT